MRDSEGTLKAPFYDLKKFGIHFRHIMHVHFTKCFAHVLAICFKSKQFLTMLQRFQIKSILSKKKNKIKNKNYSV